MDESDLPPMLSSLLRAVDATPDDVALRLHTAGLLLEHGRVPAAVAQCSAVLDHDPGNAEAIALLAKASARLSGESPTPNSPPEMTRAETPEPAERSSHHDTVPAPINDDETARQKPEQTSQFDWQAAEVEVAEVAAPPYVDADQRADSMRPTDKRPTVRLADVAGLEAVKKRLDMAFLTPMRNPEMSRLFRRSLPGGLLLYGPPGCGKTFLARAIAGELGAHFTAVALADVLNMWIGGSERNLHETFQAARRNAPCVLFFDEIDALGQKRSGLQSGSGIRSTVNQLLTEMDSVDSDNEGLFILAATNQPWDVDSALMRPGRFDRLLLVEPPDQPARVAILKYHLRGRPIEGIDIAVLAARSEHFSGADLAHLCDTAAEQALMDSVRTGQARPIGMVDFEGAFQEVKPSTGPWLQDARNVVMFANSAGKYDDLVDYLKRRKMT